jgi:hypothetical protein
MRSNLRSAVVSLISCSGSCFEANRKASVAILLQFVKFAASYWFSFH